MLFSKLTNFAFSSKVRIMMKYYVLSALLIGLTASCGTDKKLKEQLPTVVYEWGEATRKLDEAVTKLDQNINSIEIMSLAVKQVKDKSLTLSPANQERLKEMTVAFDAQFNGLKGMKDQLAEYHNQWKAGSLLLQSIEEGVNKGKAIKGSEEKLDSLSLKIPEVEPKVEEWNRRSEGALMTAIKANQEILKLETGGQ